MEETPKKHERRREESDLQERTNENIADNLSEETKLERRNFLDKIEKFIGEIFYTTTIFAYDYSTEEEFLKIAENAGERIDRISNIDKESLENFITQHLDTEDTKSKLNEEQIRDVINRYVKRFCKTREEKKADGSWYDYMQFQGVKYGANIKKSVRAKKELKKIEKYIDKNA